MNETMPFSQQSPTASLAVTSSSAVDVRTEGNRSAIDSDHVCWIELKRYPYHPDHQVELLHLQAEADALIIKLQAASRKTIQHEN